ncbi:MAG: ATPase, T2SS/T4P/T4SS family [Pseudomonadota bacterium]|nr:ATPase, T2SS/T4P/T4SS family [Pseudomonadota bacterium]HBF07034.1 MSHA biogenesis protein MshE [Gammaproteobacteria bacterium]|tara:strand:- start:399 stop:2138 length:1740 start_codon:yes stop_codon:yes gene_type:complete
MEFKSKKKVRLGDLLVEDGFITDQQLKLALSEQVSTGKKIGQTLVDLGFIEEEQLMKVQATQLGVDVCEPAALEIQPDVVNLLSESLARRYRVIPISSNGTEVTLAMSDPTDIFAIDELRNSIGKTIKPVVAREREIMDVIDRVYKNEAALSSIASELETELGFEAEEEIELDGDLDDDASDAPVVRLIQSIFEDALSMRASDIHIEPDEHVLRIRFRVDGVLHEKIMKEKRVASALVMRLKIMASLDISEKRKPQDGRFPINTKIKNVDVRISTLPTQYGESVVMRILDQSALKLNLAEIGMPEHVLRRFEILIQRPHGIILVTGPTGSGKTTTLYSALTQLNKPGVKIITAEDPVEYRLPRIQQVQVNEKIELTFTSVLRSALRQDPDIVLVGEIRDQATSEIALKAAMTGHLVLSTLHTNDAISSAIRLVDMGAPAYLVSASVNAVLAQRLVRKNCEKCLEDYTPSDMEMGWLVTIADGRSTFDFDHAQFKHSPGCRVCNNSGYYGRIGAYELLEMTKPLQDKLRQNDMAGFAREAYRDPDYETLAMCALRYAFKGIISVKEVFALATSLADHSAE